MGRAYLFSCFEKVVPEGTNNFFVMTVFHKFKEHDILHDWILVNIWFSGDQALV